MSIAIIGFGPRGLYSLERLIFHYSEKKMSRKLNITIYNSSDELGTGSAWNTNQPDCNLINIDDKSLDEIPHRPEIILNETIIPKFSTFSSWSKDKIEQDENKYIFFSRNIMGEYLLERAKTMTEILQSIGILTIKYDKVLELMWEDEHKEFIIKTENGDISNYKQCLLTLGHLKTKLRDESKNNMNFSKTSNFYYVHNPYSKMLADVEENNKNVAVIGFGLTAIDIIRLLTVNLGGTFIAKEESHLLKYIASGKEPKHIVPYSLDGLPAMPKPLGKAQDNVYKPSEKAVADFKAAIMKKLEQPKLFTQYNVLDAFAEIVTTTLKAEDYKIKSKDLKHLAISWLISDEISHPQFLDTNLKMRDYLLKCVEMAIGKSKPSLDYAFGQIWRHMQPILYPLFTFTDIEPAVMAQIIAIDERTKRYSYGPPMESILQLIALIDSEILNINFLTNPEIKRTNQGWKFRKDDNTISCEVLINSVLSAPNLSEVDDSLVSKSRDINYVIEYHNDLGMQVDGSSKVINDYGMPLFCIGRMTKGNVLGADAILECFNSISNDWAEALMDK